MSSAGFAQGLPDRSEAAVDSLLDPPLAAVRPLRFERATADLGTLREEDAPVRRRFVFKNRSDETIAIVRGQRRVQVSRGRVVEGWHRPRSRRVRSS